MKKNCFIINYKYTKIAFRFLGILGISCFLCFLPFCRTYAKQATSSATAIVSCLYTDNSSIEKMESNDALLEQMAKEQKILNQTYKEKVLAYKNSNTQLSSAKNKKLQQINNTICKKNKLLKKNLNALALNKKKYQQLSNPNSEKAKKRRKTIISLQNTIIDCMQKINHLFNREITILDSAK